MATRRDLPADFIAALDRYPAARERFAAMPSSGRTSGSRGSTPAAAGVGARDGSTK